MNRLTSYGFGNVSVSSSPRAAAGERAFRAPTRLAALGYALRGLLDAWRTQPNLRLHVFFGGAVVSAGCWVGLTLTEWLWISFSIGLVIFAELMNTAIEQTVDLVVGSNYDPMARQVKDVAAGFVLVAAIVAVVVGSLTFGPHIFTG